MTTTPSRPRSHRAGTVARTGAALGLAAVIGVTGLGGATQAQAFWGPFGTHFSLLEGRAAYNGYDYEAFRGSFPRTPLLTVSSDLVGELVVTDFEGNEQCRTDVTSNLSPDIYNYKCRLAALELGTNLLRATVTTPDGESSGSVAEVSNNVATAQAVAVHRDGVTTITGTAYPLSIVDARKSVSGSPLLTTTTADADGAFSMTFEGGSVGDRVQLDVTVPEAGAYGHAYGGVVIRADDSPVAPEPGPDPVDPGEPVVAEPAPGEVDEGFTPTPEPVVAEPAPGEVDEGFTPVQEPVVAEPGPGVVDPGFVAAPLRFVGTEAGSKAGYTAVVLQTTPNREVEVVGDTGLPRVLVADGEGVVRFDDWLEGTGAYSYTAFVPQVGDLKSVRISFEARAYAMSDEASPSPELAPVRLVGTSAGAREGYTKVTLRAAAGRPIDVAYGEFGVPYRLEADSEGLASFEVWLEDGESVDYVASVGTFQGQAGGRFPFHVERHDA